MKSLILLIAALFAYKLAGAQVADIDAGISLNTPDSVKLPLYVLIVHKKVTILDTAYRIDPKIINGIYFLEDKQKSVNKFGDKAENGVVFITTKKKYLAGF